jgi:hypothetical protein
LLDISFRTASEYQGVLYETLTSGFNFQKLQLYFSDPKKRENAVKILEYFYSEELKEYSDKGKRLDLIREFRWGYSMYEVDGVFLDHDKKDRLEKELGRKLTDSEIKEQNLISEERVQVIRIALFPNIDEIRAELKKEGVKDFTDKHIRSYTRDYLRAARDTGESEMKKKAVGKKPEETIIRFIDNWVIDTGIFIFGYLICEICEKMENGATPQSEIWVTSFWNLSVNKVKIPDHLRS